ncbi:MAG: MiaB/RimO family radical SAM methylthiotransferase, partial [Lentisphaerae bacterium]|nr:MiaB/RimO family radical SAM methylthiotransferase [Lentisphaerota bacterium]
MKTTSISFKTIGCRLNQAETAQLRASCLAAGLRLQPFGAASDISVIHGCMVTARAEEDSLRLVRSIKRRQPHTFVVLAGCAAQLGDATRLRASGVDLLAGQKEKFHLPALLAQEGFSCRPTAGAVRPHFSTQRALVKIQDGCNFHCTYCIVPAARGAPRSRPTSAIISEIRQLAGDGFREFVLTGVNLGCYEDEGRNLRQLLELLESQTPAERLRLSSIELTTVERGVLDHMAASHKLCRFLHIPLQSGSDNILAAMDRRYTAAQYRALVAEATRKIEGLGLGSDIMVGFPGESAADFAASERLLSELPISNLHVFSYSPRPGTPAARSRAQVPEPEKKRRAARLIALGRRQRQAFAQRWIGRETSVLIESVDAAGVGRGWSSEYLPVLVQGCVQEPRSIIRFRAHT